MATKLFPRSARANFHRGTNSAKLDGNAGAWNCLVLSPSAGGGALTASISTVNGPTSGVEMQAGASEPIEFISDPVSADVTISGTITINIWGDETSMSANVALNAVIDVIRAVDRSVVQIAKSANAVELGLTAALNNFTVTPTSTVVNRGDRIRVRLFGDDSSGANMATGFVFHIVYEGGTGGASGDTWIQFTETFSFESLSPSGTIVWLDDAASDVSTADLDWLATIGTSASIASAQTMNTVAGYTAGLQVTNGVGGSAISWFTNPLQAFTLGGCAKAVITMASSQIGTASAFIEIAVVNNDGSSPSVWGIASAGPDSSRVTGAIGDVISAGVPATSNFYVGGDDKSVSAGQRLRFRIFFDDLSNAAMVSGRTVSLSNASHTIQFPQTIAEQVAAQRPTQRVVNQAVMRAATRFQKLTRRRSGLFVPEGWETPIEVPA